METTALPLRPLASRRRSRRRGGGARTRASRPHQRRAPAGSAGRGRGRGLLSLAGLLALGAALRLPWLGFVAYPHDLAFFHAWAQAGARLQRERGFPEGPGHLYDERRDLNYPPLYPLLLAQLPGLHARLTARPWDDPNVRRSLDAARANRSLRAALAVLTTTPRAPSEWVADARARLARTGRRRRDPTLVHAGRGRAVAPQALARSVRAARAQLLPLRWDGSVIAALKAPAVAADLALGALLFLWARRRVAPTRAALLAGLWLANPLAVYDSAYFGQVDSIPALLLVAALLAAVERRLALAWALLSFAAGTKIQTAVVAPALAAFTFGEIRDDMRRADSRVAALRLARIAAAAVLPAALLLGPFLAAGTFSSLARAIAGAFGDRRYAYLTVNAYNLWWLVLPPASHPFSLGIRVPRDSVALLGSVTARQVGVALFAAVAGGVFSACLRSRDRLASLRGAAALALAFYLLPTEIKARYGFPAVALLLPLATSDLRYAAAAALLSGTFLLNVMLVQPLEGASLAGLAAAANRLATWPWAGHACAALNLLVLASLLVDLWRSSRSARPRPGRGAAFD